MHQAARDNSPGGKDNNFSNRDGKAKPIDPGSRQRPDSLTDPGRGTLRRVPTRVGSRTNRAEQINNKARGMRSQASRMHRVNQARRTSPRCKVNPVSVAPLSHAPRPSGGPWLRRRGGGSRTIRAKVYLDELDYLSVVIAGLVPAISIIRHDCAFLSEMAGTSYTTSPAMTS
jgi:hypothetical protein